MSGLIILLELMSSFATIADLDETLNKSIHKSMISVFWSPHFLEVVPAGYAVLRVEVDNVDQEATMQSYANLLFYSIYALLLGIRKDCYRITISQ